MPSKLNCGVQYITSSHHHNDLTLMDYATIVLPILRCHAWTCRNNSELRVYKAWLDVRTVLCKLLMLSTQSRDSKYIYSMCKPTCSTTQQNTNRCFIYIYRERERENHAKELAAPLPRCVGDVRRYKPDFSEEDTENRKREWEWNVMLYPPIPAYGHTNTVDYVRQANSTKFRTEGKAPGPQQRHVPYHRSSLCFL